MESSENKKPVKRTSTKSKQFVNKKGKKSYTPTKRTDTVRPKASTRAKRIASAHNKANSVSRTSGKSASHAASSGSGRATATGSKARSTYSTRSVRRKPATKEELRGDFVQRITSSRAAIAVIAVVFVLVLVGAFDAIANWGKAYGNVYINGINVGGMTSEQMVDTLKTEYAQRISHAQVTIYANEKARQNRGQAISQEELEETADEISVEDANARVQSWNADALTLKGDVPYEKAVSQALAVGRENGGIGKRFGLLVGSENIDLGMEFDESHIEDLASQIDLTIGDPRVDTTVIAENGSAHAVQGHAGTMVDRPWLEHKLSDYMMADMTDRSFVAEAVDAQSRITMDQANEMADSINRAIEHGVDFKYQGKTWTADANKLSAWTVTNIVGEEGNWKLEATIDASLAVPTVVKEAHAEITSDDMTVTFKVSGSDVSVHTQGTGNIPEVSNAIAKLQDVLYGPNGIAWGGVVGEAPVIEIEETDRPESLTFDDALNMGVISPIGEYTTEFSNYEGTENRNHNIKLVADIFNNGIIEAKSGKWSFNDRSGNTNEEAGFWTAGSIVNGEYVDSVGGGICQVATTVFNAVLEAGLEVPERHNHTLYIASYPTGRDAAVDYPSDLDLVWKNSLPSDILLKASYTDTSITIQLFSVKTGYSVEFELGSWQEGAKYSTRFERDSSLPDGSYYRKTVGENGSKIDLTREVSDEKGNNVRTDSFQSNYSAKDEVYVIGDNVDTSALGSRA